MKSSISVIIPTLNEEDSLPALLRSLIGQRYVDEIIVVDGGSTDNTKAVALEFPVIWGISGQGRGKQMNQGATLATCDILLFLHADTLLGESATTDIPLLLSEGHAAGTFRLKFDSANVWLGTYAWFTRWNCPLFLYGDQGLFLYRTVYDKVGGYEDLPIMEDVSMIRRLGKLGKLCKSDSCITTSSRRFLARGPVMQQLTNLWLVLLFRLGVSPDKLVKRYPVNK